MSGGAWEVLSQALRASSPSARDGTRTLGRVTLYPHQAEAARRLATALDRHGVALLADAPGLGKTYTALAAASAADRIVIVAPAALRPQWRRALQDTAIRARLVSHEGLSRAPVASEDGPLPDVVIVDEAHHARTPTTRRWRHLAALCRRARVLLVSATPLHNRPRDLEALFALRLGPRAARLDPAVRAACIVRRDEADVRADLSRAAPPAVARWTWWRVPDPHDVPLAVAQLPPVVASGDAEAGDLADADALWRIGLMRAWASSGAAFERAITRRLAMTAALDAALAAGLPPARGLVRRWLRGDDAVQLPLALSGPAGEPAVRLDAASLAAHAAALRALLATGAGTVADAWRVARVRRFLGRHPDRRVLIFAQYEATARCYFRALAADGGCALLTGTAARIAGGRVTRRELLEAFGPAPPTARRALPWRVLVATDVVGEGVDLQGASAVVHADLPWTPARLAQRVGRVARIGAAHRDVAVAAFAPPMPAEHALGQERRLRAKAAMVDAWLGTDALTPARHRGLARGAADPQARERLARLAEARASASALPDECGAWLGVGRLTGWVAVVGAEGRVLAARWGAAPREDAGLAWRLLRAAEAVPPGEVAGFAGRAAVDAARDAVRRWRVRDTARHLASPGPTAGVVRRVLERLADAARRSSRGERARAAAQVAALRAALAGPIPAGAIETLRGLSDVAVPGAAWIARLADEVSAWLPAAARGDTTVRALFVVPARPDTIDPCPAPCSSTSTEPSWIPSRSSSARCTTPSTAATTAPRTRNGRR